MVHCSIGFQNITASSVAQLSTCLSLFASFSLLFAWCSTTTTTTTTLAPGEELTEEQKAEMEAERERIRKEAQQKKQAQVTALVNLVAEMPLREPADVFVAGAAIASATSDPDSMNADTTVNAKRQM